MASSAGDAPSRVCHDSGLALSDLLFDTFVATRVSVLTPSPTADKRVSASLLRVISGRLIVSQAMVHQARHPAALTSWDMLIAKSGQSRDASHSGFIEKVCLNQYSKSFSFIMCLRLSCRSDILTYC